MGLRLVSILVLIANGILTAGILVFAIGFFPHKAVLPGLATWSGEAASSKIPGQFDRLIFMVVDALRSDFVYGNASSFHFTQSLIRSGAAIPFTGHASPPTITMPKVKAITTGSVPSFIDLILNFAESDTTSTLATQDSWLAQMRAKPDGRLIMFGDDTWLRLFPNYFERSDGTTSFFVSDFTEVDHNVTRNVPENLSRDDWSAMILHYLGLDHIGHKTGPQGPNMPAKQREMDGIIKDVYQAMETQKHLQNTLLVLLGDHGMNEGGNHGASSAGETSTALTFISPIFKKSFAGLPSPINDVSDFRYYDVVEQSDIAPTLAALFRFPIPKNSLGAIIPRLLNMWVDSRDRLELLYENAFQLQRIAAATFPDAFLATADDICNVKDISDEQRLACDFQKAQRAVTDAQQSAKSGHEIAMAEIRNFVGKAQSLLSSTASKYDLTKMSIGILLSLCAFILSGMLTWKQILSSGLSGVAFVTVLILYAITMFASSYVEEEHQFWYWICGAWLVLLTVKSRRRDAASPGFAVAVNALTCILFAVSRRWNQTGQKYAGDPDLVTESLVKMPWLLWFLIIATYALISRKLSRKAAAWGSRQMAVVPAMVTVSAFLFKLAFTAADAPELLKGITIFDSTVAFVSKYSLVKLARLVFLGLGQLTLTSFFYDTPWVDEQHERQFRESLHSIISLLLVCQTRTVNIPIFLIFQLQASLVQSYLDINGLELTLTSLILQYCSFFAFGGTNAISSVDLSNAYNGVSGYNVVAVGILTFLSNWAGPVWWTSATSCLLAPKDARLRKQRSFEHFAALTTFSAGSTLAVMIACMVLREHLFIWTVFSPRYLYSLAWIFGQHVVINGLFGSLLLGL